MTPPPLISPEEIRARQERARQAARERGLDGLVVIGRSFYDRVGDLAYLSGHFPPFPATAHTPGQVGWGHGLLVIPVEGPTTLVADPAGVRGDLAVADEVERGSDLAEQAAAALQRRRLATGRLGVVGDDVWSAALKAALAARLPALEMVPADDLARAMRSVKSPAEQALLRHAAALADRGLRAALEAMRAGAAERDVCAAGTAAALAAGADFVRYLRVHSGPWSALGSRWPQATDRRLGAGELVTLDIIGAYGGYQFDVLRTALVGPEGVPVGGGWASPQHGGSRLSQRETEEVDDLLRVAEAVREATVRAVQAARPGVSCAEVARTALACLDERGFGRFARAFCGHGIGLETVEEPLIVPDNPTLLQPGMVLCIEPGAYLPGRGGASIEQEVIITERGCEVITFTPTRLWP